MPPGQRRGGVDEPEWGIIAVAELAPGAHRCSIRGLYASFGRVPGWLAQDQQRQRTAGWQRRGANGFMRCRSGSQQAGTMAGVLAKTRAQTAR